MKHNQHNPKQTKVQNIKGAIQYALTTEQGKAEMDKTSFRDGKSGKMVWRNPAMAEALACALIDVDYKQFQVQRTGKAPKFRKFYSKQGRLHPLEEYQFLRKRH